MELPTYTNIWRIEKRLYKLYDFRLPMPLPVGQIAVFTAITVPYVVILNLLGLPFSHTLLWLYVLPPGVLAWLATRPVLEGKRLPELVVSQVRYLGEPRTWCRMAPLAEKDEIMVSPGCGAGRPERAGDRDEAVPRFAVGEAAGSRGPSGRASRCAADAARGLADRRGRSGRSRSASRSAVSAPQPRRGTAARRRGAPAGRGSPARAAGGGRRLRPAPACSSRRRARPPSRCRARSRACGAGAGQRGRGR